MKLAGTRNVFFSLTWPYIELARRKPDKADVASYLNIVTCLLFIDVTAVASVTQSNET